MKKILLFTTMLLAVCLAASAQYYRSYYGCEHTGPLHQDTDSIEFTYKDKPNAKVMVFTYHKCGTKYHGTLWSISKSGRLFYERNHLFLAEDPARMSIQELRKALWKAL